MKMKHSGHMQWLDPKEAKSPGKFNLNYISQSHSYLKQDVDVFGPILHQNKMPFSQNGLQLHAGHDLLFDSNMTALIFDC